MAVQFTAQVCGHLTGIAGSNSFAFVVCCACSGLCDGLITRIEETYSVHACACACVCVCLILYDIKTSKRGKARFGL